MIHEYLELMSDPLYWKCSKRDNIRPILLVPGFLASNFTLSSLRSWLRRNSFNPYFSDIKFFNDNCPYLTAKLLRAQVFSIYKTSNSKIIIIGHSLGGTIARYLGIKCPEYINHIICLGSPIRNTNSPVSSLTLNFFKFVMKMNSLAGCAPYPECGLFECRCNFFKKSASEVSELVKSTSIYTKSDFIINWQACIAPDGENFEVKGSHVGLIWNKEVYKILLDIL